MINTNHTVNIGIGPRPLFETRQGSCYHGDRAERRKKGGIELWLRNPGAIKKNSGGMPNGRDANHCTSDGHFRADGS